MDNIRKVTLGVLALLLFVPALALASAPAEAHHAAEVDLGKALFWPCVNFVLYLGVLTYCVRRMLNPALRTKAQEIEAQLDRVSKEIAAVGAELKQREVRRRGIAQEQQLIRERLEQDGLRIAQEVVQQGEQAAAAVRSDVEKRVDQELKRATAEVRQLVVEGAAARARQILRTSLSKEDDNRLRQEAINGLFE